MNINPVSGNNFTSNLEGEVKEKEAKLPFDVVKLALADLVPQAISSSVDVRKIVSIVLTDLSNDDTSVLDRFSINLDQRPYLKNNLFDLVSIYKDIKSANSTVDHMQKVSKLCSVVDKLLDAGDIDKAIEVVNTIPGSHGEPLKKEMVQALIAIGDFDKATGVANTLSGLQKTFALGDISLASAKVNNVDKAVKVASLIDDIMDRGNALINIAIQLRTNGNVDRASVVADRARVELNGVLDSLDISTVDPSKFSSGRVVSALAQAGRVAEAIEIAKKMRTNMKNLNLSKIAELMVGIGNIDVAISIADEITNDRVLKKICDELLKFVTSSNINKATELANKITNAHERGLVMARIAQINANAPSGG
jgi:hypothetical protein